MSAERRRRLLSLVTAAGVLALASQATGASPARVTVLPRDVLVDARVTIAVTGLRPRERVTVRASTRDAAGRRWRGSGVFRADAKGRVDVSRAVSVGGTYRGRDGLGVLWSMNPQAAEPVSYAAADVSTFLIEAIARRRVAARTGLVRRARAPGVARRELTSDLDGFVGRFSADAGAADAPAILLLGGSEGGMSTGLLASLLASRGYSTLQLAYFRAPGLPQQLREIPLEYFRGALAWLAGRPEVDPARIVVFGISRGAEAALLLGATYPELVGGVVAYVPSSVVNSSPGRDGPAWTLGGRPVPYAPFNEFGSLNPSNPAAIIPVERIDGPVLLVSAGQDATWPSGLYAAEIVDRRAASGKSTVSIGSLEAGHAVGSAVPYVPVGTRGGSRAADAALRARAWPRVLRLLAELR